MPARCIGATRSCSTARREQHRHDRIERGEHRGQADEAAGPTTRRRGRCRACRRSRPRTTISEIAPARAAASAARAATADGDEQQRRRAEDERRPPEVDLPGRVHPREVEPEAERRRAARARRRRRRARRPRWCSTDASADADERAGDARRSASADGLSPVAIPKIDRDDRRDAGDRRDDAHRADLPCRGSRRTARASRRATRGSRTAPPQPAGPSPRIATASAIASTPPTCAQKSTRSDAERAADQRADEVGDAPREARAEREQERRQSTRRVAAIASSWFAW